MSVLERIRATLWEGNFQPRVARDGMAAIEVERSSYRDCMRLLRDACGFEQNTFVTAIDHWPDEPRFELLVQLLSHAHDDRVRVHVRLPSDDPHVATIVDLWPGAAYAERECFDMFGIRFDGHEGLKRLLMPEEYDHYPLRKDFPHQGIEPDRLYRAWERERARSEGRA